MHQMEESWKLNMAKEFIPSWNNVLDESMMEWLKNMCPDSCVLGVNITLLVIKDTIFVVD